MMNKHLVGGTAHTMPADLEKALRANTSSMKAWEGLTPIARNEWICWCITVKQAETRASHIKRTVTELAEGKRRPCCWIGCIHRSDKAISSSVQWVLGKRSKK